MIDDDKFPIMGDHWEYNCYLILKKKNEGQIDLENRRIALEIFLEINNQCNLIVYH